jgi:hypothetical protein
MKISEIFQEVLNEAVSRGVLYHFTGGKGFSVNVKNHGFKFHNMEMEYYEDPSIGKYESALSTTRLYNLNWGVVRFNLNGDYISSKYPIKPVHFFNRQKNGEFRDRGYVRTINGSSSVPLNQYEETILSKQRNHIMPLNNNTVFSVDILVNNDDGKEKFISNHSVELKELSDLGISYNFVTSFKPFKGIEKGGMSDVKNSVIELLRSRDEESMISYLQGKENVKEILSDVRVIIRVCSRGYLRILKEMVRLGVDLGVNDYDDTESYNMWTQRTHKERLKETDYLAIKAAGNNKDVLSILMTSDSIPVVVKYEVITNHKLEQFYNMLYNSDLKINDKLRLSVLTNDYSMFDKYFDNSDDKQFACAIVNFRNVNNKFAERCLSSDIGKTLKYKISTKYGIGNAEQYEEPKAPNYDEDLPF